MRDILSGIRRLSALVEFRASFVIAVVNETRNGNFQLPTKVPIHGRFLPRASPRRPLLQRGTGTSSGQYNAIQVLSTKKRGIVTVL